MGTHGPAGGGLSLKWSSGPVDLGPDRPEGCSPSRDHASLWDGSLGKVWQACGVWAWLELRSRLEEWLCGPIVWGLACSACCVLVNRGVEKPSLSWGLRVPKFWLSLVLYFSQGCLQCLCKVPSSWSSRGLRLCPSHHLGSLCLYIYSYAYTLFVPPLPTTSFPLHFQAELFLPSSLILLPRKHKR
jgi:hypothetical protein